MIQSVLLFAVFILLFVSLREVIYYNSSRSFSLHLISSDQNNDEYATASSPLLLRDFGVYEKNRNCVVKL